jgi:hypothetical protein
MFSRSLIFLITAWLTSAAHAGAWLLPKGHGLGIAQATYYTTSNYFDSDGNLQPQPRFSKYELQPYLEYGLLDNLTIGGSAYIQKVSQSGLDNKGIADPELFVRAHLWSDEKQIISIQPLIKFSSDFKHDRSPRGGSNSTDMELSLLYGRTQKILTSNDYIDLRMGYRWRNHNLSDQLRVDATAGLKLTEQLEIIPAIRGLMATKPTDVTVYSENGELDYAVVKAELTGLYHLNDTQWVHATFFKPIQGVQTGNGYGVTLGFAQRF